MRRILWALLAAVAVASVAFATEGLFFTSDDPVNVTCGAAGTTGTTVARTFYEMTVTNELAWWKFAAACNAGGKPAGVNVPKVIRATGTTFCCRSTGATAVVSLAPVVLAKQE